MSHVGGSEGISQENENQLHVVIGPSGVVADVLKTTGETGLVWVVDVCNSVVKEGRAPEGWYHSWILNV